MKMIRLLFNFYLNSSIHVALAVYAMTYITLLEFDLAYDPNALYFVFFASISAYNFVKYFGLAKFHHRSLANWLRVIQVFSALSFIVMSYYLLNLNSHLILLIVLLALVTFLYAVPMIPKRLLFDEQHNLRQIGGLKIYIIALVWSVVTVAIPLMNAEYEINTDVLITLFQRFCYVMALMLPFEIRDLQYDSLKLATIPQRIGIKKTKVTGVLLLMVFVMLEYFKDRLDSQVLLSTLIITFLTLLFLIFTRKKQSKYYTSFWVEALPVFWLIVLLLLS